MEENNIDQCDVVQWLHDHVWMCEAEYNELPVWNRLDQSVCEVVPGWGWVQQHYQNIHTETVIAVHKAIQVVCRSYCQRKAADEVNIWVTIIHIAIDILHLLCRNQSVAQILQRKKEGKSNINHVESVHAHTARQPLETLQSNHGVMIDSPTGRCHLPHDPPRSTQQWSLVLSRHPKQVLKYRFHEDPGRLVGKSNTK